MRTSAQVLQLLLLDHDDAVKRCFTFSHCAGQPSSGTPKAGVGIFTPVWNFWTSPSPPYSSQHHGLHDQKCRHQALIHRSKSLGVKKHSVKDLSRHVCIHYVYLRKSGCNFVQDPGNVISSPTLGNITVMIQ